MFLVPVVCLMMLGVVPAQAVSESVSLERLSLSPTREGFVGLRSGTVLGHLETESTFWIGYSDRLLSARSPLGQKATFAGDRVGGAIGASLGLFGLAEVGFVLPYVLFQQRGGNVERMTDPTTRLQQLSVSGIGDLQLVPRVRLLDAARHFVDLSASLGVSFPTSGGTAFRGDTSVLVLPSVAASREVQPNLRVGAQVGALLRGQRHLMGDLHSGSEIDVGVGASWRFGFDGTTPFEVQGSLTGTFGLAKGGAQNHSELRVLGGWEPIERLQVLVGAGAGLIHGYGTPRWRTWSGIRYAYDLPFGPRRQSVQDEPPLPQPIPQPIPPPEPVRVPEEEEIDKSDEVVEHEEIPPEPLPLPVELELTVHFAEGSYAISGSQRETVRRVADALRQRPDLRLYIDGHSDAIGVLEMNIGLSYRRANSVRQLLIENGIDGDRLEARGFGPNKPVAPNTTPEGRAENRRVEFTVKDDVEGEDS